MKSPPLKNLKPPPGHDFIMSKVGNSLKVYNSKGVKANFGDTTPTIQYACSGMGVAGWANELIRLKVVAAIPMSIDGASNAESGNKIKEATDQLQLWLDLSCSIFTNQIKTRGENVTSGD